jgi:hypothetical protein
MTYVIPICVLPAYLAPTEATDQAQSRTLLMQRKPLDKLSNEGTSENMEPNHKAESSYGKRGLLMVALVLLATGIVYFSNARVQGAAPAVNLPQMTLTLVAANGTQLVLTSSDIGSIPSYTAYGGYETQGGFIRGLGNYTGVPLIALCNLVGGLANGSSLRITASDNYTKTLSYDQANGNFTTFDTVTGQQVPHNQSLSPILAYYFNGSNLSSDEGPLRLAIVGPEQLATGSTYWVKFVVKMEILSAPAEFPWLLLLIPIAVFAAIIAAIIIAAILRRRGHERSTGQVTQTVKNESLHISTFQNTRYRAKTIRTVTKRPSAMRTTFNSFSSPSPHRVKAVFNAIST